jgi:hypothetical protein
VLVVVVGIVLVLVVVVGAVVEVVVVVSQSLNNLHHLLLIASNINKDEPDTAKSPVLPEWLPLGSPTYGNGFNGSKCNKFVKMFR